MIPGVAFALFRLPGPSALGYGLIASLILLAAGLALYLRPDRPDGE